MKKISQILLMSIMTLFVVTGCGKREHNNSPLNVDEMQKEAVRIELSDDEILVDNIGISQDVDDAVYMAKDIIYYEEGQDFTYGEGSEADAHSKDEADKHTVVHITKPGTYALSGSLSYGQIAIDLGKDAKEDETAVVHLILDGVDINCDVAPAVIFYNVYECGDDDEEKATKDVDTSKAGANVYIADDTTNNIEGSYVAKIYASYELNEEGTEVIDSKKLHKYDGAFYSKRSMNIYGGSKDTGVLNIVADNEGLDSELHLTIYGGNINIESGNDGINTNEDEVSVTTINGGTLNIIVTGSTGEGDGIDSNGWLVINGGTIISQACSTSGDAGMDSDMGIHINGGKVIATGNMLDRISEGKSTYAVFTFSTRQKGGNTYSLKNDADEVVLEFTNTNDFRYLIVSADDLQEGDYTLWCNDSQCEGYTQESADGFGGGRNGQKPEIQGENGERGNRGEFDPNAEIPEGMERPERIDGKERPEKPDMPEGMEQPESGEMPDEMQMGTMQTEGESTTVFTIVKGSNYFSNVKVISEDFIFM